MIGCNKKLQLMVAPTLVELHEQSVVTTTEISVSGCATANRAKGETKLET